MQVGHNKTQEPKVPHEARDMKIHNLFVLKKTGVPVYQRRFTDKLENVDFNLLSSFFSAILDFSSAVVRKDVDVLDMGELRFFFKRHEDLIYILIADVTASSLLARDRLKLVRKAFTSRFSKEELACSDCVVEDVAIDHEVDTIVTLRDTAVELDDLFKQQAHKLEGVFEAEIHEGEIRAGALLSLQGDIFYSSLPADVLHTALKELEVRIKTETSTEGVELPKFIWQTESRMIFSQCIYSERFRTPFFVVLLFDATTSLGMADFALETIVAKLVQLEDDL